MNRRELLKSIVAGSLTAPLLGRASPGMASGAHAEQNRIPEKGEEFNESFVFPDEATGRQTRRITSYRQFNQKPTYHINAGFSPDNKHLCFNTWNPGGRSALVRANVESGDCVVIDSASPNDAVQFQGQSLFMIPKTNYVSIGGKQNLLYDIFTLERRTVLQTNDRESYYSAATGTCDGRYLLVAKNDHHYDYRKDRDKKDPYKALGFSLLKVDLKSGDSTEIYRDNTCKGGHIVSNPVNPDLILFHRDFPPKFGHGGDDGKTSRDWILNIRTGELIEVQPRNRCKFTWHANWSADGRFIYYHGPSKNQPYRDRVESDRPPYKGGWGNEHFIGVANLMGEIVWEKVYPYLYYGHASSHATKNIIIVDNLLANEFISGIHWQDRDQDDNPRIELIAKHNSTYAPAAQTRHPHCQMSNDGKWISYNSQFDDRSDVYVVKMK